MNYSRRWRSATRTIIISNKYKDIVDQTLLRALYNEETGEMMEYCVLKVFQTNHQISELGIVNQFSSIFKDLEIPILYINSFSNNFILIPDYMLWKLKSVIDLTLTDP